MDQFFSFGNSDDNGDFDVSRMVEELDDFFQENGAGLDGTIDLVYSDMDRVNRSLVDAMEDYSDDRMEELYESIIEWGQHVAHLIYYVSIAGEADAPEGFTDFVMNVPAIQLMLAHMQHSDSEQDELQRLALGWMEIRSDSERVLEHLSETA